MDKPYCCPPGDLPGLVTDYKPKGTVFDLDGLEVYTNGSGPNCIIWCYDIYGKDGGHSKELVDLVSSWGYTVYLPDFLKGAWPPTAPKDEKLMAWLKPYTPEMLRNDILNKVVPYAEKNGAKQFGMVGTCWGAWAIFTVGNSDKFKFGINTHPSVHLGKVHGQVEMDLAKALVFPQVILNSDDEPDNIMPGGELVVELEKKFPGEIICKHYKNTKHGYFSRGPMDQEDTKKAVEDTLAISKEYMAKHFAK